MIEIRNLRKSFGSTQALNDVNLTVPTGTVYGLVGPNGAGKSTLIQHITGIYRPDAGTILVDDVPVFDNPEVKRKIFCIYDDIYYYMYATTRDLKRFYQGLYPNFDEKRYEALREAFPEIKDNQPLRSLSKGMLKQSAFWLALCCRPEILVLDEPVDGLDPVMRRQVWSLLMGDVAEHGYHCAAVLPQPAGIGRRLRPCGYSSQGQSTAGAESQRSPGQRLQNPSSF